MTKVQKRKIPAFLKNIRTMLQTPIFYHIVRWAENGVGFVITDTQKFQQQVLPQFFKHKNYTSFVRQLNMYGFNKQRHSNFNYFVNQYFRKQDLYDSQNMNRIALIKRKPQKKKKNAEKQSSQPSLKKQNIQNHQKYHEESQQEMSQQHSVSIDVQNSPKKQENKMITANRLTDQAIPVSNLVPLIKQQNQQKRSIEQIRQKQQNDNRALDSLQIAMFLQNKSLSNVHELIRKTVINIKSRNALMFLGKWSTLTIQDQKIQINNLIKCLKQQIQNVKNIHTMFQNNNN